MRKFYRLLTVLAAAAFIGVLGCQNSLLERAESADSASTTAESEYGTLIINNLTGRALDVDKIVKADITVSGIGMTDINKSDVSVTGGKISGVTIEKIPAGKNRVISIQAKRTIETVLENMDGVVIRAVTDIKAGETVTVNVTWKTTAVGNVFYKLVKSNYDVSSLSPDKVKSRLPTDVNPGLIDAEALANDIKTKTNKSPESYKLKGGTVKFKTDYSSPSAKIRVNDTASNELTGSNKEDRTIAGIAPGNWTFYIIEGASVYYSKKITIEEGKELNLGNINIQTIKPRLENEHGYEITNYSVYDSKAVKLRCRLVDGETYLVKDTVIYYTLDGTEPTESSPMYDHNGEISVSAGQTLKAFAKKQGLPRSETVSFTFVAPELGYMHPSKGAFSPVGEAAWDKGTWELGAHISGSETTFALYSANASKILLEIYDNKYGSDAKYDYWMKKGSDDVWRAKIKSAPHGTVYAFRCWGPNWEFDKAWTRGGSDKGFKSDVDGNGNRFNPNKVLFDPYAREMTHDKSNKDALGSVQDGGMYGTGGVDYKGVPRRNFDTGKYAPKGYVIKDNTSYGNKPKIPQEKALIYEAHVRGITKHPSAANLNSILNNFDGFSGVTNIPEDKRGTYAGAAMLIPYLKGLGINTIELLPVHESDNDANPDNAPGGNFWGYMTYGFFAPDRRYSSDKSAGGPTKEFKEMVSAFHAAGMEVYLDVVFNHTGEGGVWGDKKYDTVELTFMHGIDNSTYYSLTDDKKFYWESTGCGNNMQCDNPVVRQFILDSLKYWITDMGVDGFRFDLATVLGRERGKNSKGELAWNYNADSKTLKDIVALGNDNDIEMIAESWDTGDSAYQVGNFPNGWGGWNGRYRDAIRSYIGTGNRGSVNDFINGDYNNFDKEGGPHKSVNFIVAHDGFTLADLCSYQGKGNAQNQNVGWPFGPSDGGNGDYNTLGFGTSPDAKRQAARNYIAVQMMSRGVPMIVYGDELGRTQNGNNNPYNIDSVATWNNYNMINNASPHSVPTGGDGAYHNNFGTFGNNKNKNGNFEFAKYMMKLHASEPALNQKDYKVSYDFKKENGTTDLSGGERCVWIKINGSSVPAGSDYLVFMNMHTAQVSYTIPEAGTEYSWVRLADTQSYFETDFNCWSSDKVIPCAGTYGVAPWSVVILKKVPTSSVPEQIKTPVIKGNTPFASTTSVTVECETSGTEIYYTTDGSEPTGSSQKYTTPFTLNDTKTVKAVAKKDGRYSDIATKKFLKGTVAEVPKSGVMIQVFNWASAPRGEGYNDEHPNPAWGKWYNVIKNNASAIKDNFAYAWFPPPGKCSSDSPEGYAPTQINDLNNYYGKKEELKAAITALGSCKAVADIVVNHRGGTTSWGDFTNPEWGVVKGVNYKAICSDDEGFEKEPQFMGKSALNMRGKPDTGEKYDASRDLDHTNLAVQQGITDWMNDILRPAGFVGWRYDFVKGYGGKYVGQYNRDTLAEFSVGEHWPTGGFSDSNPDAWGNTIKNWVQSTEEDGGTRSRAFDFALKGIMNTVFGYGSISNGHETTKPGNNNYGLLAHKASLLQSSAKDAVTFVDNHDTGSTQKHWYLNSESVGTAYAFILTHPGFPCVAWQHYFTAAQSDHVGDTQYIGDTTVPGTSKKYKDHIDYLMQLRKDNGIGYDSNLTVLKHANSVYAAKITGTSGELVVVIGADGVYAPSGDGYDNKHAVYGGTNFTIWQKNKDGTYGAGTPVTYTVPNMPVGWGDASAVQYVWIYGGTDGSHWVKATFDSGANSLTFSTAWDFTKLIAVRMPAGSDVPDWDKKWNQSSEMDKPAGGGSGGSGGGGSSSGGSGGGGSSGTVKTYTVTDMPEWWGTDSAKQYVWLFKTGASSGVGDWVSAELQGNTIKFSTDKDFDKVITARMKSDVTNPGWNSNVLNQSLDIEMPSGQTTAKFYYTVTEMPSWWGDANAKQYVWVVKGSETGSWVPAELQGNVIKFSTSKTFDKVVTVRMKSDTTTPDWSKKDNQSADLPVTNNTAVYAPGT
ncbi:MAG: chitobiase/beta-hexosaminidase C-terminal domain-containing protein [Treponema sp.]